MSHTDIPTPTARPVAIDHMYSGMTCANVRSSQNATVLTSSAVVATAPSMNAVMRRASLRLAVWRPMACPLSMVSILVLS